MAKSRSSQLARGLIATVVASGAVTVVGTDRASAYNLLGPGCRFDPNNDDDGLGIGFNGTNFHQLSRDATEDGAARWNYSGGPATFTIVGYSSSTRDVRVTFENRGATGAPADIVLPCGSSHFTSDPNFRWNLDFKYPESPGGYSEFRRRSVTAIHEFGHSYRMDHNQAGGCDGNGAGLMYAPSRDKLEACGWDDPTTDDVKGAHDGHDG